MAQFHDKQFHNFCIVVQFFFVSLVIDIFCYFFSGSVFRLFNDYFEFSFEIAWANDLKMFLRIARLNCNCISFRH